MTAVWRPIPGYSRYEASPTGDIRKIGGNCLRPQFMHGYPVVRVVQDGQTRGKTVYSHRLTWAAFNGPIPAGYCVGRRDGQRGRFTIDNLMLRLRSKRKLGKRMLAPASLIQQAKKAYRFGSEEYETDWRRLHRLTRTDFATVDDFQPYLNTLIICWTAFGQTMLNRALYTLTPEERHPQITTLLAYCDMLDDETKGDPIWPMYQRLLMTQHYYHHVAERLREPVPLAFCK